MISAIRTILRSNSYWLAFRELNREGWARAWRRRRIQKKILSTPPVLTAAHGPVEVRLLCGRRDWINALWALKSFYHYAEVDYPLFLHDGGLLPYQRQILSEHFPRAVLITAGEAETAVQRALGEAGWGRCLEYRKRNISTRKLFDFFLLSQADALISIDSDIVFFRRPSELLDLPSHRRVNRYNRDCAYHYSMSLEEIQSQLGIRATPMVNSGLSVVYRESIDFTRIDDWLRNPKLFADVWVTEQTLHALCSSLYGVELLPDSYRVSTEPGLHDGLVCKHYPGFFRPLLYQEGMAHLIRQGFLDQLRRRGRSQPADLRCLSHS